MPVSTVTSSHPDDADSGIICEDHIEYGFIGKLQGLKYQYRPDITNRATPTSFKASSLFKHKDYLQKSVFVVDRQAFDRETWEEWSSSSKTSSAGHARRVDASSVNQFKKFHEGFAEQNTTAALVRREKVLSWQFAAALGPKSNN